MDTQSAKNGWQRTRGGLTRYGTRGNYYAYFKVGGKLYRRSLGTDVYTVAKLRLGDVIAEQRALCEEAAGTAAGKLTFADALREYRRRVESDPRLKPASRRYRIMTMDFIVKSWPGILDKNVRKITGRECAEWFRQFQKRFAPSVVNNSLGTLRATFAEAIERGARFNNPAAHLKRVKIRQTQLALPNRDQFIRFIREIESAGAPRSKDCADFVRFLAFSGLRKTEAKFVTWADVDFQRGEITVRGHPETGTKNDEIRRVPMIPELRELLESLRRSRPTEKSSSPVLRVFEAEKSMRRAAANLGIPHLRHHDLRHLFASTCIESGVDIPTVSRWLGHKDGGALAMKVYGHLRQEHSALQAQRVRFGKPPEPASKLINFIGHAADFAS